MIKSRLNCGSLLPDNGSFNCGKYLHKHKKGDQGSVGELPAPHRDPAGHVIHKEARLLEVALGELSLNLLLGPEVALHYLPVQPSQLQFIRCFIFDSYIWKDL